jgi:hypothetical protein
MVPEILSFLLQSKQNVEQTYDVAHSVSQSVISPVTESVSRLLTELFLKLSMQAFFPNTRLIPVSVITAVTKLSVISPVLLYLNVTW